MAVDRVSGAFGAPSAARGPSAKRKARFLWLPGIYAFIPACRDSATCRATVGRPWRDWCLFLSCGDRHAALKGRSSTAGVHDRQGAPAKQ